MNARADIGRLLAEQLDAIKPDLDRMAHPYRRAEQLEDRIYAAIAELHELACACDTNGARICLKHRLINILNGEWQ